MKSLRAFVRMLLITILVAWWWFGLIPALQSVAEKSIPGFAYSWDFFLSLYGISVALMFGIPLLSGLGFLFQMALRLADWVCANPEETQKKDKHSMNNTKLKLKALGQIETNARRWRSGVPPEMPMSIFGGLLGFAVCFAVNSLIFQLHESVLIIGVVAGAFFGFRTGTYMEPKTVMYNTLAMYQPVNVEAYRNIQKLALDNKLSPDAVIDWAQKEREILAPRQPDNSDLARQRFTAK